ncbi:MAG: sensor histidine kinase [Vogesella sp.]|nr:sensor histidine kinase [Vogesella sp.]
MSQKVRLDRWFWQSFLRTALIPLLVIELGFLLIYWVSAQMIYQDNSRTVGDISKAFMPREVQAEARALSERLNAVSGITGLFARQTGRALQTPYTPAADEKSRYQRTPDGALITTRDNGGAAAYYSGIVPLGPQQQETIDRSAQLDPVLKDVKAANPLIAQVYLNTKDSYNRIYPYFEVKGQYPAKMDIPSFNFYYEADGKHNPARKPVWTDAYLDPAGQGWMVSSIAPVWQGDTLQAVVGIDITLKTVVDELLALDLPWGAYVMLIGRDGTILALPPQGEHDWGLQELGAHSYTEAIRQNVFKPEKYRIDLHPEGKKLAALMGKGSSGIATLPLRHGRQEVVAWSRVAGPNWTMLMVAEEPVILAAAQKLHERMTTIGWFMLAALLVFYAVFFALLARRARQMSQRVVAPLASFQQAVEQIGAGQYRTTIAEQPIMELNALGQHIGQMALQLEKAASVEEQARQQMEKALATERQINQQQQHFIEVLSHEVRTPLAQIDSVAQALQRRGSTTDADTLKVRLGLIREAGERLEAMLDRSLLALLPVQDNHAPLLPVSLPALLDSLVADGLTDQHIQRQLDAPDSPAVREPLLRLVVQELLQNASSHGGGQLRVASSLQGKEWLLRISDGGPALPADELAQLLQPFYRRSGDRAVGSGLGLTMVARFVNEMGGRLQLESAEGEGLIVSVYLPLTEHGHD